MRTVWMFVYLTVVCGPTATIFGWDYVADWVITNRARRALETGRCQRPVSGSPGGICGMPIAARIDLHNGTGYRYLHWLCYDHAVDAERRATGRFFRVTWLNDLEPPSIV
jgi:hypothetical protein